MPTITLPWVKCSTLLIQKTNIHSCAEVLNELPDGKIPKPNNIFSIAGAQLPACLLENPSVHRLLTPGQLPTPVLTKRLSPIFLWAEFSQSSPIPKVNLLLKTVFFLGGIWGAHSYLDSPKYNKITNNLRNWIPILVMTC